MEKHFGDCMPPGNGYSIDLSFGYYALRIVHSHSSSPIVRVFWLGSGHPSQLTLSTFHPSSPTVSPFLLSLREPRLVPLFSCQLSSFCIKISPVACRLPKPSLIQHKQARVLMGTHKNHPHHHVHARCKASPHHCVIRIQHVLGPGTLPPLTHPVVFLVQPLPVRDIILAVHGP